MIKRFICHLWGHQDGEFQAHHRIGSVGIKTYKCPRCTQYYERTYRIS